MFVIHTLCFLKFQTETSPVLAGMLDFNSSKLKFQQLDRHFLQSFTVLSNETEPMLLNVPRSKMNCYELVTGVIYKGFTIQCEPGTAFRIVADFHPVQALAEPFKIGRHAADGNCKQLCEPSQCCRCSESGSQLQNSVRINKKSKRYCYNMEYSMLYSM